MKLFHLKHLDSKAGTEARRFSSFPQNDLADHICFLECISRGHISNMSFDTDINKWEKQT